MSSTLASCVTFPYPKGKKMGCQWRPFASWVKNLNMKHLKCKIFHFQACCPNTLGDFRETPISLKEVKWSVTTLLAPGVMCQVPINPFESVYNQKHLCSYTHCTTPQVRRQEARGSSRRQSFSTPSSPPRTMGQKFHFFVLEKIYILLLISASLFKKLTDSLPLEFRLKSLHILLGYFWYVI